MGAGCSSGVCRCLLGAVMAESIKLSAPEGRGFWEIPVVYEDAHLLALNKPAGLLVSPDRYDRDRPNIMRLVLDAVAAVKPWVKERGLTYLSNAHRLDFDTTGVLVLAKDRESLVKLAEQFGNAKPRKTYIALVSGSPASREFEVDLKLRPDLREPGRMRWAKDGKKSLTRFRVLEDYGGMALVECHPETGRTHQIRVHLLASGHPILADPMYGDGEKLLLSRIKRGFRAKEEAEERPLTPTMALHAWRLELAHPVTGETVRIEAPWPKDLEVAVKFLRRYCGAGR
jgi:RluA family pseudouridine synthase